MLDKEAEWLRKRCSDKWRKWSFRNTVYSLLPIIEWLPKYELRKDLPADIAAGLTLGIMNIPQGKYKLFYTHAYTHTYTYMYIIPKQMPS